ncbi:MAG TPA: type II toxin-antitoxin system RelE/ParE family toxin [Methanocella sp.]|uniref:type II toxin-antitoxin system RelE/ParE family toxin n=1 Tax=Methanocella sp. TaxID=2052833 RepID=UPI002C4188FC|nr:type II toxin-antitoxin system RelE/ParE family toxin [Methanocella sp.]HTY91913.1 type II toxin-antitoxin system RelE/ParE family toxin [Methanocella sp.]
MKVDVSPEAENDLDEMDNSLYVKFKNHLKSLGDNPYQRHLEHGLPYYVKDFNKKKYKIVYTIENDTIYVERCFDDHKKYDRWLELIRRKMNK